MGVPQQIKKQVDEAEELAAKVYGSGKDAEPEKGAEEPEGEEAEQGEVESGSDTRFGDSDGGEAADDGNEEHQTKPRDEAPDASALEHKYKTLQGMYNSEKKRNADLVTRIHSLEQMMADLQTTAQKAAPQADSQPAPAPSKLITDEDLSDYGSDLIDVMKRAAQEAVRGELDALRSENNQLKQLVGKVDQKQVSSDRNKVFDYLDKHVENWRKVNTDPEFLTWLAELDAYAGVPRKDLLSRAFQSHDTDRVARFFLGFLNETAAVNPGSRRPNGASQPSGGKGTVDMAKYAAPGAGSASRQADDTRKGSGRTWKESEIGDFYDKVRRGAYQGRESEIAKVERQIQSALSEGRILVGR